jgi:trehalose 6-phosphate phosphatase
MTETIQFSNLRNTVACADRVFLVSDFDGTLCPIASSPELVCVLPRTRDVLERLAACPRVVLAILSGRRIEDVQTKAGISWDLIYGGNHGLELTGPDLNFLHPEAPIYRVALQRLCVDVTEAIAAWDGAWIENKHWTATVHMRSVPHEHWPSVRQAVQAAAGQDMSFALRDGHAAIELIPKIGWDKGSAVRYLQRELRLEDALTICLGDDETDETMFRTVPEAISIRVGTSSANTAAKYRLDDVDEVTCFLELLLSAMKTSPRPEAASYGSMSAKRSTSSGSI